MNSHRAGSFVLLLLLAATLGAAGQSQEYLPFATPPSITYAITLNTSGSNCVQTVTYTDALGNPHNNVPMAWVSISESNDDLVTFAPGGAYTSVTVAFPNSPTPAFPGTPFYDSGNWMRSYSTSSGPVPPPATLTAQEQAARFFRFSYSQVTLNPGGVTCGFPSGGMGIQVTK